MLPNLPLISPEVHAEIVRALLPRRQEIFAIITDHPYITFDAIARRFPATPGRTLAYDVTALVKQGLVQKHGVTRGVCYTVKEVTIPSINNGDNTSES